MSSAQDQAGRKTAVSRKRGVISVLLRREDSIEQSYKKTEGTYGWRDHEGGRESLLLLVPLLIWGGGDREEEGMAAHEGRRS